MNSQQEAHALTMHDRERVDAEFFGWAPDIVLRPGQIRKSFDSLLRSYVEAFHSVPCASTNPRKIARPAHAAIHPWLPVQLCLIGRVAGKLEPL